MKKSLSLLIVFVMTLFIFALEKTQNDSTENVEQRDRDEEACVLSRREGTKESWKKYLKTFPEGDCSFEAKNFLEREKEKERKIKEEKERLKKARRKNFPHKHENIKWSNRASTVMDHSTATKHCQNLGGRLPTISELRTLIRRCAPSQKNGACKVTDNCLHRAECRTSACNGCQSSSDGQYSVFSSTGWLWSSSLQSGDTNKAWYVNFNQGLIDTADLNGRGNVRCVMTSSDTPGI